MEKLENILLNKVQTNFQYENDIYIILRKTSSYFIVKRIDTITNEEEIKVLYDNYVEKNLYTAKLFFEKAIFVGKSGYFSNSSELDQYISQSHILVYKDEYNQLMYDAIMGYFYITPSIFRTEDFIPYENQEYKIRFKKGVGKKY